jgi:hypothetical protein
MVSISIPWAALGCLEVAAWVHRWVERESLKKRVSIILLFLLLGGLFIQGRVLHPREHRVIQKEAGLWMKDHLPRGVKMMSRLPQEAFYAEQEWTVIPVGGYEKVLRVARSKGVKYLVIDDAIEKDSPGFLEKIKEKDLILLKDLKRKKQKMVIFEIIY